MAWLSNTHVRRWRQHWHSVGHGHVYQGRFKSFLVQDNAYFLTLARYIEANPLRAKLVKRAEQWPWSSLSVTRSPDGRELLSRWKVRLKPKWLELGKEPLTQEKMRAIQESMKRGRPLGEAKWMQEKARQLGLEFTLRPRGRPRKEADGEDANRKR
jgi:putative transposase